MVLVLVFLCELERGGTCLNAAAAARSIVLVSTSHILF